MERDKAKKKLEKKEDMVSFMTMERSLEENVNGSVVGGGRLTRIMSDVSTEHLRPRLEPSRRDRRGSLYGIRVICDRVHKLAGSSLSLPGWILDYLYY